MLKIVVVFECMGLVVLVVVVVSRELWCRTVSSFVPE